MFGGRDDALGVAACYCEANSLSEPGAFPDVTSLGGHPPPELLQERPRCVSQDSTCLHSDRLEDISICQVLVRLLLVRFSDVCCIFTSYKLAKLLMSKEQNRNLFSVVVFHVI